MAVGVGGKGEEELSHLPDLAEDLGFVAVVEQAKE